MQTYENKGAEVLSNGSAGHINGAELSRMREVAFEKNQSEPLVHRPTHTHMHKHTHKCILSDLSGSFSLVLS